MYSKRYIHLNPSSNNWTFTCPILTLSSRCSLTHWVTLHPDAPYFIILLCLTPDYFTLSNARRFYSSRGERWHWMVNWPICLCVYLTHWVTLCPDVPYFIILLCLMPDYFTLSIARRFYSSRGERWLNGLTFQVPCTFDAKYLKGRVAH
jgi:hypothetical protein